MPDQSEDQVNNNDNNNDDALYSALNCCVNRRRQRRRGKTQELIALEDVADPEHNPEGKHSHCQLKGFLYLVSRNFCIMTRQDFQLMSAVEKYFPWSKVALRE